MKSSANPMKKHTLQILFCTCLVSFLTLAQHFSNANDLIFSKIGTEQGLSQLSVMSIYQDEHGAMWFGTREGVNRYNGNFMEVFRPLSKDTNSLTNNIVKSIQGDQKGNIYILTQGGINRYNLQESRMTVIQRTEADAIFYGNRHLWIADNNSISFYENQQKKHYFTIKEAKTPIRALCETSDQRLIVGTLSSGVWMINQKKEVHQLLKDCSTVSSIFEDLNRNIWIGTWKQGLFRINPNGEIRNYQYNPANKQGISSDFVRAICQDNQGTLWIGTRKGLDHLNLSTDEFVHYNSGIGVTGVLTNESIWSLYKDQQGTLWIGTYFGGVNYFNPSMNFYTLHDLRNGSFLNKPFHVIGKILEDLEGRIILGTEGNGLIIYNRNNKTYQNIPGNTPGGISSENIKSFYYDKANDKLWIGTHLGGLTLVNLKNLTTTQYKTVWPDWSESDIIRSIIPYENDLLIATHNGLFRFNINNGGFSIFSDKIHKQVKFFNSIKIRDGQEGLEMTIEHQPDIVLSDLMMPRLSGAEMCSKIKNNFAVSHIPVVLLTAQTAIEYNIEGLKLGADDYITKPFNVKALITRCNNLVNNRRMLQEKYSRQIDFSPLMLATNKIDSDFMQKAHQVVEKHMDNADFDVKLFSEELGLSRTCLFTKLKGVTGQTPNDFIMNVRLKKAAELL